MPSPSSATTTPPRSRSQASHGPGTSPLDTPYSTARLSTASSTFNSRLTMIGNLLARPYSTADSDEAEHLASSPRVAAGAGAETETDLSVSQSTHRSSAQAPDRLSRAQEPSDHVAVLGGERERQAHGGKVPSLRTGRVLFAQPQAVEVLASVRGHRGHQVNDSTASFRSNASEGSVYLKYSVEGSIHGTATPEFDRSFSSAAGEHGFGLGTPRSPGGTAVRFMPEQSGLEDGEEIIFSPSSPYSPGMPQTPRTPADGPPQTPGSSSPFDGDRAQRGQDVPYGKQSGASAHSVYTARTAHTAHTVQSMESGLVRPPTIVLFPEPQLLGPRSKDLVSEEADEGHLGEGTVIWAPAPPSLARGQELHFQHQHSDAGHDGVHAIRVEPAEYAPSDTALSSQHNLPPRSTSRLQSANASQVEGHSGGAASHGGPFVRSPLYPAASRPAEFGPQDDSDQHPPAQLLPSSQFDLYLPSPTFPDPGHPFPPQTPHVLPLPSSPISPFLASPPSAREGVDEQLASPLQLDFSASPGPASGSRSGSSLGGGGGAERATPGRQGKTLRSMMSVITLGTGGQDFWKRLEMGHEGRAGQSEEKGVAGEGGGRRGGRGYKDKGEGSEWLAVQRGRWRRIKWAIWGGLGLVAVTVIVLIVVFVGIKPGSTSSASSSSSAVHATSASAIGAGASGSGSGSAHLSPAGATALPRVSVKTQTGHGGLNTADLYSATTVPARSAVTATTAVSGAAPSGGSASEAGDGEEGQGGDQGDNNATRTVDGLLL